MPRRKLDSIAWMGRRLRQIRLERGYSQAELAKQLKISPSYLNLIEHDQRALPASLLLRMAAVLEVDLQQLGQGPEQKLLTEVVEAFGDPLFDPRRPDETEVREFVAWNPRIARAFLALYQNYEAARSSTQALARQVQDVEGLGGLDRVRLSSELVSDFLERHGNHFPDLETAAEQTLRDIGGERDQLFSSLARFLERRHGVRVIIEPVGRMQGALRRYDERRRELWLSETLRRGSRNFQLAHQLGLLSYSGLLDRLTDVPPLAAEGARPLARVALASYFAAAVLMPYVPFLAAGRELRYDVDLLGHRFRVSYEQACHRLTTLRRRGQEGVSFGMVRLDVAGNISKKFQAGGPSLPRFSGLCPLWVVHAAFLNPGFFRVQISRLPDGQSFFSVARTVRKQGGGYQTRNVMHAIGLSCSLADARELVYADGLDLADAKGAVAVGVTCRLCERQDCPARAFPALQVPLRIDENVRGLSFYAPVGGPDSAAGPTTRTS